MDPHGRDGASACTRRQFASVRRRRRRRLAADRLRPAAACTRCRRSGCGRPLDELEREYSAKLRHGRDGGGHAARMPGVLFAYALDISRCIGCRRCVYACVEENNQSRDPQVHWIRVL